jgi:outer membrane protein
MRMKNAMRTLVVSLLALSVALPAAAETLPEAQAAAVESNPALAAQRQRLNATREALPQAWSEALPQINVSGSATRSANDSDNPALDTLARENWSAGASASQLLFGGGRVLASTRGARAQIRGAVANY